MILLLFLLTTWTTEVITSDSHRIDASIALDSTATPYILVFKGYPPGYLRLYYKNNGNWLIDTIESNKIVYEGDIAIDRYNHIWCSYTLQCDTVWYFIVAHKDSTDWIKDTVGIRLPNQAASFYCSMIDIDSCGSPH